MTPHEHYAQAERLLEDADQALTNPHLQAKVAVATLLMASAQVHATLATCGELETPPWRHYDPTSTPTTEA